MEGRTVLVVQIEESERKPVYAKDETGKYLAYLRDVYKRQAQCWLAEEPETPMLLFRYIRKAIDAPR